MAKRKRRAAPAAQESSSSSAPPSLPLPSYKFGEYKIPNVGPPPQPPVEGDGEDWTMVSSKRQKQAKELYPAFHVSPHKLKSPVGVTDLQALALWILADGASPQWLAINGKSQLRRVVVVMVPGLEFGMFSGGPGGGEDGGAEDLGVPVRVEVDGGVTEVEEVKAVSGGGWNESDFHPVELKKDLLPSYLKGFANMFTHAWPVKTAGDSRSGRLYSPITGFLNSTIPKGARTTDTEGKRFAKGPSVGVTKLVMSPAELEEDGYPLHSVFAGHQVNAAVKQQGWVETDLSKGNDGGVGNEAGSLTEGKAIYAIDCEMCQTTKDMELTRISVLNWEGDVVYDVLVKPENTITDYLTVFSGMTKEKLETVTTTLKDVQDHLLTLFNNDTILVGQSLNFDLNAMKISHPHIVDTSVIYHHARGPPFKPSLKWLSTKFLKREIQNAGKNGHNSIEDARACLDLLKLKLGSGLEFGTIGPTSESIFTRLRRVRPVERIGAVVDSGTPERWFGAYAAATISAVNNSEVVEGIKACVHGDPPGTLNGRPKMDFVWSRIRSLEQLRGWNWSATSGGGGPPVPVTKGPEPDPTTLAQCIKGVTADLNQIYDSLPPCSVFIVYSGSGDPTEMRRLQDLHKEFKKQYATTKWDNLTVKWTDTEEQALKAAIMYARQGVGFMTVK